MMRVDSICQYLIENGNRDVWLFPYGKEGMEIYNYIKNRYSGLNVIRVDNNWSKYNKDIISFSDLQKLDIDNKVVIYTANNPQYYQFLKLSCLREKSIKMFCVHDHNPLCYSTDERVRALAITAEQIYNNGIEGAVAEVGVFQGHFAKFINFAFPERELYLFDTFEGFDSGQIDLERDDMRQTIDWIDAMRNTNEEIVMQKMTFKERVKICKGFVPESLYKVSEKFCFASFDMNLYEPTYKGLEWFWPHLSPGGYIFVHCFRQYEGIFNAVTEFCRKIGVGYVCMSDINTVCIAKAIGEI